MCPPARAWMRPHAQRFVVRVALRGTFFPSLRASERPIAIACFRLFTVPPFPPLPLFSFPCFARCKARSTSLLALLEYFLGIPASEIVQVVIVTVSKRHLRPPVALPAAQSSARMPRGADLDGQA